MHHASTTVVAIALATASLLGCPGDDGSGEAPTTGGEGPTGSSTAMTVTVTTDATTTPPASDASTAAASSTGPEETSTTGPGSESSSGATGGTDSSGTDTDGSTSTGALVRCPDEDLGSGVPQGVVGDNSGSGDDITPSCSGGGQEYMYSFTAPADGWYRFDTTGSSFDTVLALFEDCTPVELACNDDAGDGTAAIVERQMTMGETVTVVVEGGAGEVGAFELDIESLVFADPPADYCAGAGTNLVECLAPGGGTGVAVGSLSCDDTGTAYYWDTFEIPVQAGDCLAVTADNIDPAIGATGLVAGDLLVLLHDPNGTTHFFDDEIRCTDPPYAGYACPFGGVLSSVDGTFLLGVSQWGGPACPDPAPYVLNVSRNGVDVDLSAVAPIYDDAPLICG